MQGFEKILREKFSSGLFAAWQIQSVVLGKNVTENYIGSDEATGSWATSIIVSLPEKKRNESRNLEQRNFVGDLSEATAQKVSRPWTCSLRGMFKNLFKIVTCGAFRGRTTFPLPHGVKDLNNHYNDLMTDKTTGKKNARPGF